MRTTTEVHRRRSSAIRISVDGFDGDDILSASTPYSRTPTPRSTQPFFEKHSADSYDSSKSSSPLLGSQSPNLLSWKAPRARQPRTWIRLLRRSVFLVAVGFFVYVLVASRKTSPRESVARLQDFKQYFTMDSATRRRLRTDHTYAYGTPLPNQANAYEEHPVHGLIREAKQQWNDKVARQSKSYYEAVREYQRRNRRDPPPGFKEWYRWAKEHKVQLIDEFDTISNHIEPFLAVRPSVLRKRIAEHEDVQGWGTNYGMIYIGDGRLEIGGATWRPPVTEGFVDLMEPLAHLLPNVTVPLHLHDGAGSALTYSAAQGYRRAAREGRFADEGELNVHGDNTLSRTQWQCEPESPYRRRIAGLDAQAPPAGPAFIRNHNNAMSFCMAPETLELHGANAVGPGVGELRPSFALSKTETNGDLLWPSTILYDLNPKNESSFREKANTLLWRGSPDGVGVDPNLPWRQSHRFRLITLLNSNDTQPRTVRETRTDKLGNEYQIDVERNLAELNARYSNVRATGVPVQCWPELCDEISRTMEFVPKMSLEEMADNRYVMDVDGNAYSARFRAHLASNQVPFKSTVFPEFYDGRIQPWVHYVPVRVDYSDLYNLLAFFDGGADRARTGNHDGLAEEIAMAGADWAAKFWRVEDMQAYVYRLLLEWARVLDPKRED
ncbi:hypothetical protein JCM10908_007044 [Rhodotorula pacifica]|uniref:uncharacterized protein n=1 Tax=Rhodotorula pacifica TaxID=1495444 RepID=UPI00317A775F